MVLKQPEQKNWKSEPANYTNCSTKNKMKTDRHSETDIITRNKYTIWMKITENEFDLSDQFSSFNK